MSGLILEVRDLCLDEINAVAGATTLEEAVALMNKWNAAIITIGQVGIEGGGLPQGGPSSLNLAAAESGSPCNRGF